MMWKITLFFLVLLYIMAAGADFLSPHPYDRQYKAYRYHPPTRFHLSWDGIYYYSEALHHAKKRKFLRFFKTGHPYRLLGITCHTHFFLPPNPEIPFFLLGTDKYGRDIFSRMLKASRVSLFVSMIAILISFSCGLLIGGVSGYFGGKIDTCLMRFCEILMCFPFFFLMLALRAAFPVTLSSSHVYLCIILIFSLLGWPALARVIRGMVLALRQKDFITNIRLAGMNDFRIIIRHILPNTFSYALVAAFLSIPSIIIGEASLSFLGLGIQEPEASWGNMLSDAMSIHTLAHYPWVLWPGVMIFISVILFTLTGDFLRDRFDVKTLS